MIVESDSFIIFIRVECPTESTESNVNGVYRVERVRSVQSRMSSVYGVERERSRACTECTYRVERERSVQSRVSNVYGVFLPKTFIGKGDV